MGTSLRTAARPVSGIGCQTGCSRSVLNPSTMSSMIRWPSRRRSSQSSGSRPGSSRSGTSGRVTRLLLFREAGASPDDGRGHARDPGRALRDGGEPFRSELRGTDARPGALELLDVTLVGVEDALPGFIVGEGLAHALRVLGI